MNYPLSRTLLLLVVVMFFMLSACEKDTILPQHESTTENLEPAPKNYMVFEDQEAFMKMISKPVSEIIAIQAELFVDDSFTSYKDHFASIEKELADLELSEDLPKSIRGIEEQFGIRIEEDPEGGKVIIPAVRSLRLAAIANEHGVYKIGNDFIQLAYDQSYTVAAAAVADHTDLSTSPGVHTTALYENNHSSKTVTHECIRNYFFGGKEHRLRVQWAVDYLNVSFPVPGQPPVVIPVTDISVLIRHQKRGVFGIWFANQEDRIWTDGRITHITESNAGNSTDFFNIDHEAFNSSSLFIDIFLGPRITNIPNQDWIISPSWALHSSRDDGTANGCFIQN